MSTVRAWKDPEYRAELRRQGLPAVADNPAGVVELSDSELGDVAGGTTWLCVTVTISVAVCCDTLVCGSCRIGTRGCC